MDKKPTSFQKKVEDAVRSIPKGETWSYGEVASVVGHPGAARAVGSIMANNKDKTIPCHRVIHSDGTIGAYNSINGPSKEELLRKEGCIFKNCQKKN